MTYVYIKESLSYRTNGQGIGNYTKTATWTLTWKPRPTQRTIYPLTLTHSAIPRLTCQDPVKSADPRRNLALEVISNNYRKSANRKNGDPDFNLVKDNIVEYSDLQFCFIMVTSCVNSIYRSKENCSPVLRKSYGNLHPLCIIQHFLRVWQEKGNSPPIKTIGREHSSGSVLQKRTPTRTHDPTTELVVIHESAHNTSGSSSYLNLNSWDGIIEDYFDDVSNNHMPFRQEARSGPNHEISITGGESTHRMPSHSVRPAEHPLGGDLLETSLRAGSENNPIQLDSTPKIPPGWNTNQDRLHLIEMWAHRQRSGKGGRSHGSDIVRRQTT